jgi:alpha-D-ribose 1-methylphosphonate 5-triphosphate synthase subunit PhnL
MSENKPLLFIGPQGSGKTLITRHLYNYIPYFEFYSLQLDKDWIKILQNSKDQLTIIDECTVDFLSMIIKLTNINRCKLILTLQWKDRRRIPQEIIENYEIIYSSKYYKSDKP